MGRPYAEEMSMLAQTYAWAQEYDITAIRNAVMKASTMPLVAVGSGGSMTTAAWLAYLHRNTFRALAQTATPLQLESTLPADRQVSVWLLSASGRNTDILRGFDTAVQAEPRHLVALCASEESPLGDRAAQHPWTMHLGFAAPAGRDGFLATNSLFASCLLLTRAVLEGASIGKLPSRLDALLEASLRGDEHQFQVLDAMCSKLWQRDTLLVLHGNTGQVASIDIESRFTEAALGCVQLADFRNFAHGRHHWLAKRGSSSAILAIVDPGIAKLADQTLRLLPRDVPVVRIELADEGVGSALASLYLALRLAESAGRARGIDPGRPSVPEFGRRIYNLRPPQSKQKGPADMSADECIAIERKVGVPLQSLGDELTQWRKAYSQAFEILQSADIRAVVLDHDGTMVTTENRFVGPEKDIVAALVRLLELGTPLGIATGRGDSIRGDLQQVIPRSLWSRVLVGYRNGSEVGTLDEDDCPDDSESPCEELAMIADILRASPLARRFKVRTRPKQITVTSETPMADGALWVAVMEALGGHAQKAHVVRSSHSVDILAPGVSKRDVITQLVERYDIAVNSVLRIGDRGRWPGNDFELLDDALGLSVDEVSRRPDTCWNLAPPGERGVATTLRYLGALVPVSKRKPLRLRLRLEAKRK